MRAFGRVPLLECDRQSFFSVFAYTLSSTLSTRNRRMVWYHNRSDAVAAVRCEGRKPAAERAPMARFDKASRAIPVNPVLETGTSTHTHTHSPLPGITCIFNKTLLWLPFLPLKHLLVSDTPSFKVAGTTKTPVELKCFRCQNQKEMSAKYTMVTFFFL